MRKNSFSQVLSNKGFVNLWLNQILVQIAYNSLNFALLIWVFKLTNSSIAVSGLMMSIYLPAVIFGLFVGVLVDVFDRRKVISLINLLLTFTFLSLIVFKNHYFLVIGLTFLINTLAQFYMASEASSIPIIIKDEQLLTANSLFQITNFLTFLFGFGFAGPIISIFGINFLFGIGSLSLASAFLLSWLMPPLLTPLSPSGNRLKKALAKANLQEIEKLARAEIQNTLLLVKGKLAVVGSILIISMEQAIVGIMAVLAPSFFENALSLKATDVSTHLIIPLGIGMIIGGVLIGRFGSFFRKRSLIAAGITGAGVTLSLISFGPFVQRFFSFLYFPVILTFMAWMLGLSFVAIIAPTQTIIQEQTPESLRAKVFSILSVSMSAFAIIPVLFVGVLSDVFGPTLIIATLGIVVFFIGVSILSPKLSLLTNFLPDSWKEFLNPA